MGRVADQPIVVEFWDVGQGDCSVIRLDPNRIILIDVGPRNSPIVDYLASHPEIEIVSIVLTHNHSDHAGALVSLLHLPRKPIENIYYLVDTTKKDRHFARVHMCVKQAHQRAAVSRVRRLEAPQSIWTGGNISINVKYPEMISNVDATSPNQTAGIITFEIGSKVEVVWASDSFLKNVLAACGPCRPKYMAGPHHGAPEDRKAAEAEEWLRQIGPKCTFISVGPNSYDHPQPSYIRKLRRANSTVLCSQLTKLCDSTRKSDVIKSHARLGLPQPNTGIACRGPVRLTMGGTGLVEDELNAEHWDGIQELERPRCLQY